MTVAQAKRLFRNLTGKRWREGCTTSETADGAIYAYDPGMRLLARRDPDGTVHRCT